MGTGSFTEDFKRDAVAQITERGYPVAECQTARKVAPRSASNVDPLSMLRGEEAARRSWCGLRSRAGSGSVVCGELRACS